VARHDPHSAPGAITVLAACFAAGIAVGRLQATPFVWPWLAVGGAACTGSLAPWRGTRARLACLGATIFAVGAAWITVRDQHVGGEHLAARLDDHPTLARVRGVALAAPRTGPPPTATLAAFHRRAASAVFPMRALALVDREGVDRPAAGRVLVRVDGAAPPVRSGDAIEVIGFVRRGPPRLNPTLPTRSTHRATVLMDVATPALVHVRRPHAPSWATRLLRWRETCRVWVRAVVLAPPVAADGDDGSARATLVAALLLGDRPATRGGIDETFRRIGLAHVLAISGLHLGLLVGLVLSLAPRRRPAPVRRAGVIVVVVGLYLLVVEPRLPVLRAATMTVALALGRAAGRRWRAESMIALSALVLLACDPAELFRPGFQLSFGVVLALIRYAAVVRARWFGPRDQAACGVAMLGELAATAVAAAAVAWAFATPVIMHHFGRLAPWTVPLSVTAVPLVTIVLATGYARVAMSAFAPALAPPLGALLALGADTLVTGAVAAQRLPAAAVDVPPPGVAWTGAALAWVVAWARGSAARRRRTWTAAGVALTLALMHPWLPLPSRVVLRVDMLAVGHGTCLLARSDDATMLFDAGGSDPEAGARTIVPALRRLGVRSLDVVAISHANLDHFSAVPEVVEAFPTGVVLVTPQLVGTARARPGGPTAALLRALEARGVPVRTTVRGDRRRLGRGQMRWLHPAPADPEMPVNDASMVIAVETRTRRVLLTGDIESAAIARLASREPRLRADVLELPHHGAETDASRDLVRRLAPAVVLQSSRRDRLRTEGWSGHLGDAEHLITARDGASWVEVRRAGRGAERLVTRRAAPPR
jgi:competence protein ComEC